MYRMIIGAFAITVSLSSVGCAVTRPVRQNNNHVILVGHGSPASDYPRERLREFFRLHGHDHEANQGGHDAAHSELAAREREIREWPRTPENDPYKFGFDRLADALQKQTEHKVLAAYNEFCAPSISEVVAQVVSDGADRIIVVTTMMTPGGGHSEKDIPKALAEARKRHPNIEIVYAWPFDLERVAATLSDQIKSFEAKPSTNVTLTR